MLVHLHWCGRDGKKTQPVANGHVMFTCYESSKLIVLRALQGRRYTDVNKSSATRLIIMPENTDVSRSWGDEFYGYADVNNDSVLSTIPLFVRDSVHEVRLKLFTLATPGPFRSSHRGAFLKFKDDEREGPFDLAFYTGIRCPFKDSQTLKSFVSALGNREADQNKNPESSVFDEGLLSQISPWTAIELYSHITYSFPFDGSSATPECYVRFRLQGTAERQGNTASKESDNDVSSSYLRESVPSRPMKFQLQAQIRRTYSEHPSHEQWTSPTEAWDETVVPWQDIAVITLTNVIPKYAKDSAVYNFARLPDNVKVITHRQAENHAGLLHHLEKQLTEHCRHGDTWSAHNAEEDGVGRKEGKQKYMMHIETGFGRWAGTDSSVHIILFGTKGRSESILLDTRLHDDFDRGSRETFHLIIDDVGDVGMVKVRLTGVKDDWLLRNIFVLNLETRQAADFPCYRWIDVTTGDVTLLTGVASLANKNTDDDNLHQRRLNIKEHKAMVKWTVEEGLPGRIHYNAYEDLPRDLRFSYDVKWERDLVKLGSLVKLKLHKFVTMFNAFHSFKDFRSMSDVLQASKVRDYILQDDRWQTDEEYGRQFLCGHHPVLIRRLTTPLDKFPVTDEMVANLLDKGHSLVDALKDGRVYYIDYKHLHDLPTTADSGKYVVSPVIMFYVRGSGHLVPIAIQLNQTPGPDNPIWTPNDTELEWLCVKMWVRMADNQIHSVYTNFAKAHLLGETFAVATLRQLPPQHPVNKLLVPHFRAIVPTNVNGRHVFLKSENSVFDQLLSIPGANIALIKRLYNEFHLDQLNVVKDIASRGVVDRDLLPNYWYRDDALLLWSAVSRYVSGIVDLYYTTDTDIQGDKEIQSWVKDIRDFGLKNWHGQDDGVPSILESKYQLTEMLTAIIYMASTFHAAVNSAQEDYFSFGPNAPLAMYGPPPTKKGTVTMDTVLKALPGKVTQSLGIGFAHFLSALSEYEVYLGNYPDSLFVESEAIRVQEDFRQELKRVSATIRARNQSLELPYTYLLPERISNSVSQ